MCGLIQKECLSIITRPTRSVWGIRPSACIFLLFCCDEKYRKSWSLKISFSGRQIQTPWVGALDSESDIFLQIFLLHLVQQQHMNPVLFTALTKQPIWRRKLRGARPLMEVKIAYCTENTFSVQLCFLNTHLHNQIHSERNVIRPESCLFFYFLRKLKHFG